MITHCPSCQTHFRVHAEQLAARAGQVRCGKCGRVFDALEHLSEDITPALASASTPEPEALRVDAPDAEPTPQPAAAQTQEPGLQVEERELASTAGAPEETPEAEIPQAITPERATTGPVNLDTEAVAAASSFDFGPTATAKSAPRGRRWPWLLGALLLLLLLLAQAAYQYRGTFTLLFPAIKPYAVALCAGLGCDLPLPRRIELMSIEASDLQADTANSNVMVLSATLKNRAIFAQQHPLLELTLTDAQDQPLVRRVLTPQDYLGAAAKAETGFGANTEIVIKVFIEGSQVKATGYRLYLFYP